MMTNKKTTRRALVTSIISLLLCVSMLVGTTFAWFTDSVTSGVNQIVAGNLDVEVYTADGNSIESVETLFNDVKLWEPGAVAYETLTVANLGTLALKYQMSINFSNENTVNGYGLSQILKVGMIQGAVADTATREDVIASVGVENWKPMEDFSWNGKLLAKENADPVTLVIYWQPSASDNNWNVNNGKTTSDGEPLHIDLGIKLEATQLVAESDSFGSDYDENAVVSDILATPETVDEILAAVEPGTVIGLAEGYYDELTLTQDGLTLVSGGAVVGFLNLNAHDNITVNGLTFDASGAKATYTFGSGNTQKATGYVANITGDTNSPKAANNIVIKNCTFTNTSGVATASADKYAPINFEEQGAATERATDITIDNCNFACNALNYIRLNYLAVGNVTVSNNTFGGEGYGTSHNTINASSNAANWTVTGNSFNNWNTEKTAIGSSKQGTNTVTWTVTGNEFNNVDGAVVLALKTSYTADNSVVTVENNTAVKGVATIVTTAVNAESETVYAGHKILVNEGSAAVTTSDDLAAALTEGKDIVLLNDVELTKIVTMKGGVLDGNGNTITMASSVDNTHALIYADAAAVTIKNVTFDGIQKGAAIRTLNADLTLDNCTFTNCAQNITQGIVRCNLGNATITNCVFKDNTCSMVVTFNWDAENETKLKVENCLFENNTCADTAVLHYVGGTSCTLLNNSFVNNEVNVSGNNNAATVYLGFNANSVVKGNLFEGNVVKALESSRVRVTGGLMVGHKAEITGNAFINNYVENANGSANLGSSVCASVFYSDIDLSGNYWGGGAPVENDDYYVEYTNHNVIINDYLTTYGE